MAINWKKLYGKHADSARKLWKCIQWDEKLYQKHKDMFDALAEYDKTDILPEINKKYKKI